jgi:hypothetical protein
MGLAFLGLASGVKLVAAIGQVWALGLRTAASLPVDTFRESLKEGTASRSRWVP